MSKLQPMEIWERSGRMEAYGPDMMRLVDRRDRWLALAPTCEELLTNIVKANVNSYRDLPVTLYQIQTKFRDEPRPRGGLIRVREFDMKDAYSFDTDLAGLDRSYDAMSAAYRRIFDRCGLDTIVVDADSGAMGGRDSQEFILVADGGEDTIIGLATAATTQPTLRRPSSGSPSFRMRRPSQPRRYTLPASAR